MARSLRWADSSPLHRDNPCPSLLPLTAIVFVPVASTNMSKRTKEAAVQLWVVLSSLFDSLFRNHDFIPVAYVGQNHVTFCATTHDPGRSGLAECQSRPALAEMLLYKPNLPSVH